MLCFNKRHVEEVDRLLSCVYVSEFLWTAPESLAAALAGKHRPSQEADIYAAAIILKELFARNGPYSEYNMQAKGNDQ